MKQEDTRPLGTDPDAVAWNMSFPTALACILDLQSVGVSQAGIRLPGWAEHDRVVVCSGYRHLHRLTASHENWTPSQVEIFSKRWELVV
jgi:hypothetical protein